MIRKLCSEEHGIHFECAFVIITSYLGCLSARAILSESGSFASITVQLLSFAVFMARSCGRIISNDFNSFQWQKTIKFLLARIATDTVFYFPENQSVPSFSMGYRIETPQVPPIPPTFTAAFWQAFHA